MLKKSILAVASLGMIAALAVPAFAETTSGRDLNESRKIGTTTVRELRMKGASTSTSTEAIAKITCVGAAVTTREKALGLAMTSFTAATNANYAARATALAEAYTHTDTASVRAKVQTAWTTFTTSEKSVRRAWQTARDTAWKTYRTAAVACKAPDGTGDGSNAWLEASGN